MVEQIRFDPKPALRMGFIGGAVAVLVSLVGMVGTFGGRGIIAGVISMGQTLLLVMVLGAGYLAASRATVKRPFDSPFGSAPHSLRSGTSQGKAQGRLEAARSQWSFSLLNGALAGLPIGALLAVLVLVSEPLSLRAVFVNASPALIQILTFGRDTATGVILLLFASAILGAVAGLIYLLPARIRRAVTWGLVAVGLLGLLQDLVRLSTPQAAAALSWMFGGRGQAGLSIVGAIVTFAVVAGANYAWAGEGPRLQARVRELPPNQQRAVQWAGWALALVLLLALPNLLGVYLSEVVNVVGIFVLMGLGLNIVVGFAGLLDLGYVAFFAIGAYTMGVLTTTGGELVTSYELTFWQALPIAVAISILAGVLLGIPVLKTRGDYLAIVTLGFGEIIRILALSDFLKPYIGGSQGIVSLPAGTIGEVAFNRPQTLYYLILAGCLLAVFVATRLKDSRIGRAWMAMREDEDVAQAVGIDLVKTKLMAFGAGAAFSGLSGAIFASKLGSIYPHSFALLISINALSLIIVGGMGSIPGVIIGAVALVGLPELLREFAEFRLLVYGAALVAMMLLRPQGLLPEATRARELAEQVEEAESERLTEPAAASK